MKTAYIISILLVFLTCSCHKSQKGSDKFSGDFKRVEISTDPGFYDSIMSVSGKPRMVILKENDRTMFAFVDRVLDANGKYYILDGTEGKTIVSFSHDGQPLSSFGHVGQGPGEYKFPRDIAVRHDGLYVLDTALGKLIHYSDEGDFLNEKKLPFRAEAFSFLENGEIMFNLIPDGNGTPQICIVDSIYGNRRNFLPTNKGFVGGLYTNDLIRNYGNLVGFYRAPSDTMYRFTSIGTPDGGLVFDFGKNGIPYEAKQNFLLARNTGKLDGKTMLTNNPIHLNNGLWAGVIEKSGVTYTVLFDAETNKSGGKAFDENASVYDLLVPVGRTSDGGLICLLDIDFVSDCHDYGTLPDSIKTALSNNYRVLCIFNLQDSRQ